MSEEFDSAVQNVARAKDGDPLDAKLFWDIVIALDTDGTRRHEETIALLKEHCDESETWQQEHIAKHHPRSLKRKGDAAGEDHADSRQTWVMWNVSKKVGAIILALVMAALIFLVNVALNYWWLGHP